MTSSEVVKLDSKGRVVVPMAFRQALGMKEGSGVLLTIDPDRHALTVLPFASAGDKLYSVFVELSDAPGSLSRALNILAKSGVDLIQSESVSSVRGKRAQWRAVVDLSGCKTRPENIGALLTNAKVALAVQVTKI
jgi:AbrB family looped-hinge helix DNA binding protein